MFIPLHGEFFNGFYVVLVCSVRVKTCSVWRHWVGQWFGQVALVQRHGLPVAGRRFDSHLVTLYCLSSPLSLSHCE